MIDTLANADRIAITGGAGYLGRAIIRRAIAKGWRARFTILSRDETKQDQLVRRFGNDADLRCRLVDVAGDVGRLADLLTGHDVVIHAAAVKYIPEAELNRWETVRVNVDGSRNVALAAKIAGCGTVVGISTDKAVEPLNLYGKTKAIMEDLYAEADGWNGPTRFVTVRYGNVVGSTGSVIPFFQRQLAESGILTVTAMEMTRFWLSPDDAVDLIDDALAWHGVTLAGRCPAATMGELIDAIALEAGAQNVPPTINVIGKRPGEKLHETLISRAEAEVRTYEIKSRPYNVIYPSSCEKLPMAGGSAYTSEFAPRIEVGRLIEWIADARTLNA